MNQKTDKYGRIIDNSRNAPQWWRKPKPPKLKKFPTRVQDCYTMNQYKCQDCNIIKDDKYYFRVTTTEDPRLNFTLCKDCHPTIEEAERFGDAMFQWRLGLIEKRPGKKK